MAAATVFWQLAQQRQLHYRAMGVPDKKIFYPAGFVDNDRFVQSANLADEQRTEGSQAIQCTDRSAIRAVCVEVYASKSGHLICSKQHDN